MGIYIDSKAGVVVRSPRFLKADEIHRIVRKKAEWIIEKQGLLKSLRHLRSAKEFVSGEAFPYLGREYRLKVMKSALKREKKCRLMNGRFVVEVDKHSDGKGFKKKESFVIISWTCPQVR